MCVEVDGQKQESEMPTANIQDLKEEYFRGEKVISAANKEMKRG